jgi:prephenate dehydrogenase
VAGVVSALGADVIALSPSDHDRLVAVVSHVPHLVAATLMNAAADRAKADGALLRLAAGGFRDMTRVAAGQPTIWPDICADNAQAIVAGLDRLLGDLTELRQRVATADRAGLLDLLERASTARRELPASGTRPDRLAELRVPIPDRQGVLAEFTGLARDLDINIYDLTIAHSAEGPRGVLTLVVGHDEADRLRKAIEERDHSCTVIELP